MRTVIHERYVTRYDDNEGGFGFSGRACYAMALDRPNFPVPARLIEFDYWPGKDTDSGRPALYGHDHYKPGRWLEFLAIE